MSSCTLHLIYDSVLQTAFVSVCDKLCTVKQSQFSALMSSQSWTLGQLEKLSNDIKRAVYILHFNDFMLYFKSRPGLTCT